MNAVWFGIGFISGGLFGFIISAMLAANANKEQE